MAISSTVSSLLLDHVRFVENAGKKRIHKSLRFAYKIRCQNYTILIDEILASIPKTCFRSLYYKARSINSGICAAIRYLEPTKSQLTDLDIIFGKKLGKKRLRKRIVGVLQELLPLWAFGEAGETSAGKAGEMEQKAYDDLEVLAAAIEYIKRRSDAGSNTSSSSGEVDVREMVERVDEATPDGPLEDSNELTFTSVMGHAEREYESWPSNAVEIERS